MRFMLSVVAGFFLLGVILGGLENSPEERVSRDEAKPVLQLKEQRAENSPTVTI